MIKLRPHHLLCTQGYGGKGYSDEFVANMTAITNQLRGQSDCKVQIVFGSDDICACCPKKRGEGVCANGSGPDDMDSKMIDYFGVEQKCYSYLELTGVINSTMTGAMMDDICGECSWYPVSACRRKILG